MAGNPDINVVVTNVPKVEVANFPSSGAGASQLPPIFQNGKRVLGGGLFKDEPGMEVVDTCGLWALLRIPGRAQVQWYYIPAFGAEGWTQA